MKTAGNLLINCAALLIAALLIAALPTEMDAAIYEDTLRLHILANSNREEDQSLKYEIRDKLLEKYGALLKETASRTDAETEAIGLMDEIEADVCVWIEEAGFDYGCRIEIGKEWYETREYDSFTLPKGIYSSLRIMLGEGEGDNWWCVMYPPLCLDLACEPTATDEAVIGYTEQEYTLITADGYNVKFKILELLSDAFSKNG